MMIHRHTDSRVLNILVATLLLFGMGMILFFSTPAYADVVSSGTCGKQGDNLTWTLDDTGMLTISGTGEMEDYNSNKSPWGTGIASVQIDQGVTSIGGSAFYSCRSLTSITIPDGVTSVGNWSFYNCSGLTSITIPNGVISIGSSAFHNCYSLTSITIPEGVTSIGYGAFEGCFGLTNITIPASLTSIDEKAFEGCSNLTSITIPDGVTRIDKEAFKDCSSLTSITIPDSVTSISYGVFRNCRGLMSITIPDGVTSIGNAAFYGCSSLTSITIPDSVTSIDNYAFQDCSSLTSITIPDNVTSISNSVFRKCSSLTSITIPDSVTSIDNYAFQDCSGLTNITIPDNVTNIGSSAFSNCSGLMSITIPDNVTSISSSTFSNCSGLASIIIPDGVTSIGYAAFSGCSGLTSITIPKGVTSIGDYVFHNCTGLTSIMIPEGVTSISGYAFSGCGGLTSITIPEGVTNIGNYAFSGCGGLTSITIPEGVTSIGNYAFSGCSGLKTLLLPDNIDYIGTSCFNDTICYTSLNSVTARKLGNSGFSFRIPGCDDAGYLYNSDTQLELSWVSEDVVSLVIPEGITSLKASVMEDHTNLASIILPGTLTAIGEKALKGCESLSQIVFPDGVTSIGAEALDNQARIICDLRTDSAQTLGGYGKYITSPAYPDYSVLLKTGTSGQELTFGRMVSEETNPVIPESIDGIPITAIGSSAFYGRADLETVTLSPREKPVSINSYAFQNCTSLKTIHNSEQISSIGMYSFKGCTSLQAMNLINCGTIGESAFADCVALENINIGICYSIGNDAFVNCSALKEITLKNAQTIGARAFKNCSGLLNVNAGQSGGLESIGEYAFYGCTNLLYIACATGVTSVGNGALGNCANLQAVKCTLGSRTVEAFQSIGWNRFISPYEEDYICSAQYASTYARVITIEKFIGSGGALILPGMIEQYPVIAIRANAFEGCTGLTKVTVPESITTIGSAAFKDCGLITELVLPDTIENLDSTAFENDQLKTVIIGEVLLNRLTDEGENRFQECVIALFGETAGTVQRLVVTGEDGSQTIVYEPGILPTPLPTTTPTPTPVPTPTPTPAPAVTVRLTGNSNTSRTITLERGSLLHVITDGLTWYTEDSISSSSASGVIHKPREYVYNGTTYHDLHVELGNDLYFDSKNMSNEMLYIFQVHDYTSTPGIGATIYQVSKLKADHTVLIIVKAPASTPTPTPASTPTPTPTPFSGPEFMLENNYPTLAFRTGKRVTFGSNYYVEYALSDNGGILSNGDSEGKMESGNLFSLDFGELGNGDFDLDFQLFQPRDNQVIVWRFDENGNPYRVYMTEKGKGDYAATGRLHIHAGTLEGLVCPSSLKEIAAEAFAGLPIISCDLPNTLTTIGTRAFAGCDQLMAVTMPKNVSFDETTFEGDGQLVIYAPAGGSTQRLAKQYGIPFVVN